VGEIQKFVSFTSCIAVPSEPFCVPVRRIGSVALSGCLDCPMETEIVQGIPRKPPIFFGHSKRQSPLIGAVGWPRDPISARRDH
jgi:hypothetical protein